MAAREVLEGDSARCCTGFDLVQAIADFLGQQVLKRPGLLCGARTFPRPRNFRNGARRSDSRGGERLIHVLYQIGDILKADIDPQEPLCHAHRGTRFIGKTGMGRGSRVAH